MSRGWPSGKYLS